MAITKWSIQAPSSKKSPGSWRAELGVLLRHSTRKDSIGLRSRAVTKILRRKATRGQGIGPAATKNKAPPKRGKDLERNQDEDVRQSQRNRGCFEAPRRYRFRALGFEDIAARNRCWKGTAEVSRGRQGNRAPAHRIALVADWASPRPLRTPSTWPRL
jgi:hypothetical protein